MTSKRSSQHTETKNRAWKSLYKVSGASALLVAVFIPIHTVVFIILPPLSTVIGWFTLFQNNWLLALLEWTSCLLLTKFL